MPSLTADGKTIAQFIFNHVISRFGVPQAIVTNHVPIFGITWWQSLLPS